MSREMKTTTELKKWQEAGLDRESCIRTLCRLPAKEEDLRRKVGELQEIDRLCLGLMLAKK